MYWNVAFIAYFQGGITNSDENNNDDSDNNGDDSVTRNSQSLTPDADEQSEGEKDKMDAVDIGEGYGEDTIVSDP
ncbi:MAG: hypothetical protein WA941_20525 [Nitrososphaeraceae archaeon]